MTSNIGDFINKAFVEGRINNTYGKGAAITFSIVSYVALAALGHSVAILALTYKAKAVFSLALLAYPTKVSIVTGTCFSILAMIYFGTIGSKPRKRVHWADDQPGGVLTSFRSQDLGENRDVLDLSSERQAKGRASIIELSQKIIDEIGIESFLKNKGFSISPKKGTIFNR